jgi:hypothetical protein
MSIYRLPRSIASPVSLTTHAVTYPGLGEKPASDIWVECSALRSPMPTPSGRHFGLTLRNGERAAVTLSDFRQGARAATQALIVLPTGICTIEGAIAPAVFKRALEHFQPVA